LRGSLHNDPKASVDKIVKFMIEIQEAIIALATDHYDADDASPLVEYAKQLHLQGASLMPLVRGGPSPQLSTLLNDLQSTLQRIIVGLDKAEKGLFDFNAKRKAIQQRGQHALLARSVTQRCQQLFELIEQTPLPEARFTDELRTLVQEAQQAASNMTYEPSKRQINDICKILEQRGITFKRDPSNLDHRKALIDELTKTLHALTASMQAS